MYLVDRIRLEDFRQLRSEIRGSKDYLIVGIDVAKDKHDAFFGTPTGQTLLKRLVFKNDMDGFNRLLNFVDAVKVKHGFEKEVFGLEPTANYHKPLGEYLINCCQRVVFVAGTAVKKNREMLNGRWDKNDAKDPANIADLMSQGKFLFYDHPVLPLRDLRNLLSLKRRLKKQEHGTKVRIRNHLLAQYFPEFDRYFGQSESMGLSIVRWCLAPKIIADLEYDEFEHLVAPGNRLRASQRERLRTIWEKAADSIGCEVGVAMDFEAKMMVESLKGVRDAIRVTKDKIKEVCLQFPEYIYLQTIPGFGPDISAKVLAAIGNPFRFDNMRQVLKLSGWDLSASRSGKKSETVTPVISKKGKAELRYALYQAAHVASSFNQYFVMYLTNKLRGREREKGIKTKMKVKLAAKMLVIAWALMKKEEPFNPDFLNLDE
ncbi:MAG: IS110 family transposase [Deltaproteobacteria bacterium]|nr:IS110 family transposase [Deltaproteobacteria bacterium]